MECTVENMPMVQGEESLPATVSLNNVSWTIPTKDTQYTPYGIAQIFPNSGPSIGQTDITVIGSGFVNSGYSKCRFGVPGEYQIVEATVLSSTKATCRSPMFQLPRGATYPFSVPFSIAFNKEEDQPWTQSPHRFRFYDQPVTVRSLPSESEIGRTTEVFVHAKEGSEFIQAVPIDGVSQDEYGITCKFGRFGKTPGVIINSTTVKCVTPSVSDNPENIFRETVPLVLAQNGQNYNEYDSQTKYTFVGTANEGSFWPWIIALVLIFILLIVVVLCIAIYFQQQGTQSSVAAYYDENQPYVVNKRPRGMPHGIADEVNRVDAFQRE